MAGVSLSGSDVVQINTTVLQNLADNDAAVITFPNDLANVKTGKNGNTVYAANEMGKNADVVLRILLGSDDDKFLTALKQDILNNFSGATLLTGIFAKRVGNGQGTLNTKVYQASGGLFLRHEDAKTNAEGDTEQSVAIYRLRFGLVQVSIQ